jgi:aryl-alcohol dehydrogenase-like predicted oxidoreductase
MSERLSIGTAQFGLRYGIANRRGKVDRDEAAVILQLARSAGINALDTAISYGDSEECLGAVGIGDWRVTTKLPALGVTSRGGIRPWVRQSIEGSLKRLRIAKLDGVLLHNPADLLGPHGLALQAALVELKQECLLGGIGISVYEPGELEQLTQRFDFDLVQAPFNILDRRLESSGWLGRLHAARVEVQVRSVFLQGLLLMSDANRPRSFDRWALLWRAWREWLQASKTSPVEACMRFVLSRKQVARVVVGVDSAEQLREILAATAGGPLNLPDEISCSDIDLLNPARWSGT